MIDNYRYRLSAQVVSVDEQVGNEVYMTVTLKMISTAPNMNSHVVERSFMEAIVANTDFYMATPIKVDVAALIARRPLTHLYNERRKEFLGTQIGSITKFELVEEGGETVLYGTARIEKWRSDVVERILELYSSGKLFFSFEIYASEIWTENDLIHIGAAEHNFLTAMCIVSKPAYRDARAVTLVAEDETEAQKDELVTRIYELVFAENEDFGQDWEVLDLTQSRAILNKDNDYKILNFHAEENEGTTRVVIDKVSELNMDTKETLIAETLEPEQTLVAEGEGGEGTAAAPATEGAPEGDATPEAENVEQADPAPAPEAPAPEVAETTPAEPVVEPAPEPEAPAPTPDPAPAPDAVALSEKTKEDLAKLQRELDELRAYKAQVEADRLAAEKKEKVATLKVFAARVGIDAKANADAIEALEYDKLVASFIDNLPKEEPKKIAADVVNPLVGNGLPLKGSNKWAGFVTDPTGLGD